MHFSAIEDGHHLVFLHQIKPGAASKSFGLQVAKLAGLPQAAIAAAEQKLQELEYTRMPVGLEEQVLEPELN